jgi:hypothetical protein
MSTFYTLANLDKREQLSLADLDATPKLHLCLESRVFCAGVLVLLSDRWRGDRVAFIDEHSDVYAEAVSWPSPWETIKYEVLILLGESLPSPPPE